MLNSVQDLYYICTQRRVTSKDTKTFHCSVLSARDSAQRLLFQFTGLFCIERHGWRTKTIIPAQIAWQFVQRQDVATILLSTFFLCYTLFHENYTKLHCYL